MDLAGRPVLLLLGETGVGTIETVGVFGARLRSPSLRRAALAAAAVGLCLGLPGGAGAGKGNPPSFLAPDSGSSAPTVVDPAFTDSVVFSGLTGPTATRFASDGKVFVAEKGGKIKLFSSVSATTPTVYADLSKNVDDYWDRGMLGLAIDPNWPAQPYVYTSYTYDSPIGGASPRWSDGCPTPPGPTTDGCVVSSRLSRLSAGADYRALVMGDGPAGYWRLGESSGTTAADETGTNPGTYLNGPALAQPSLLPSDGANTSVRFDGLDDNVQAPLTARFWKNISIGWAGANTVFWNCEGYFLVQKPPTAQNYTFGHVGVNSVVFNIPLQDTTKENGHIESLDRHVTPRSLYLTQLRERLGEPAVRTVATPSQLG